MTMRAKLIEAGARSLYESTIQELRDAEAQLPGDRYELHALIYRQYAESALDAFLDCLAENKPRDLSMSVDEIVALLSSDEPC